MRLSPLKLTPVAALIALSLGYSCAHAQGIKMDPLTLYPTASLSYGHNDNVLLTTSRLSSNTTVLAAGIRAEAVSGKDKYSIGYNGTYGRYASSTVDNYNYHDFMASADMDISSRVRVKLGADYSIKSDPRGALPTAATPSPNEYRQTGFSGMLSYGASGAQGRIEFDGAYLEKRYENNRNVTQAFDLDTHKAGATFYWRIAPKTEWLTSASMIRADYTAPTSTLDNTTYSLMTGLKWEATAQTQGTFRVGYSRKDVWLPGLKDTQGVTWDGSVRWSPLSYSNVDISTGKSFGDALAGGNAIVNSYLNAKWSHDWTDRIISTVSAGLIKDDFAGTVNGRKDTTSSLGLGLSYAMRTWLSFGADYTYTARDSNAATFSYRKNLMLFSARIAL